MGEGRGIRWGEKRSCQWPCWRRLTSSLVTQLRLPLVISLELLSQVEDESPTNGEGPEVEQQQPHVLTTKKKLWLLYKKSFVKYKFQLFSFDFFLAFVQKVLHKVKI